MFHITKEKVNKTSEQRLQKKENIQKALQLYRVDKMFFPWIFEAGTIP